MHGTKRFFGMVIIAVFLLSMTLTSCTKKETTGQNASGTTQTAEGKPDISKKVELIGYEIGDAPIDFDLVMAEINKKASKDLNATLKYNFVSWGDYTTKYPLLLASGDPIDFIFDTYWVDFLDEARKGAFMPLDDLLLQYAPVLFKNTPKSSWDQAKFKGKTYMIPMDKMDIGMAGIGYREDLRVKYNVPEFKKITDLEAYFDAILKNEKGMKPIDGMIIGGGNPLTNLFWNFMMEHGYYLDNNTLPCNFSYNMDDANPVPVNIYDLPEVKEFCVLAKKWADKGFWSTKNLMDKTGTGDTFFNGTSSVMGQDGCGLYQNIEKTITTKPDWKLGYYYSTTPQGHVAPKQAVDYAICIPASSKNPERTLMFLEKLFTDKSYSDLISYGIKDKHYVENPDGSVDYPKGITSENATFNLKGNNISYLVRADVMRPNAARVKYAKAYDDKFQSQMIIPKLLVCPIDQDSIKNEVAAVNGVIEQYFNGLLLPGLATDVDKEYASFQSKLKQAGIDKVLDVTKQQTGEFLKK